MIIDNTSKNIISSFINGSNKSKWVDLCNNTISVFMTKEKIKFNSQTYDVLEMLFTVKSSHEGIKALLDYLEPNNNLFVYALTEKFDAFLYNLLIENNRGYVYKEQNGLSTALWICNGKTTNINKPSTDEAFERARIVF